MRRLFWFSVALAILAGAVAIATHGMGFSAKSDPSVVETQVALAARNWITPASARERPNPVAWSKASLRAGMEHWADHCATCHANDGSGDTAIGRSLYPRAPNMRGGRTQQLTDGELFYIIERGVPLTGMPGWGTGTPQGERESWELVHFIRHLPKVTEAELGAMEKRNPRSAAQTERDRAIQDFLSGKD